MVRRPSPAGHAAYGSYDAAAAGPCGLAGLAPSERT